MPAHGHRFHCVDFQCSFSKFGGVLYFSAPWASSRTARLTKARPAQAVMALLVPASPSELELRLGKGPSMTSKSEP